MALKEKEGKQQQVSELKLWPQYIEVKLIDKYNLYFLFYLLYFYIKIKSTLILTIFHYYSLNNVFLYIRIV